MKKRLFQYVVLFHKFKKGEYIDSQIIIEPKNILANSDREVAFKATREIDEKYASDPDNVEIIVKEFNAPTITYTNSAFTTGNTRLYNTTTGTNAGTFTMSDAASYKTN